MKTALITGIRGQDGAYLAKLLLDKDYRVIGADRRSGDGKSWRLQELGIEDDVEMLYMDLLDLPRICDVVRTIKPHEIYNLAAQSFVKASFDNPLSTANVNAIGCLNLLEAIRRFSPGSKFYQASTSEMFGSCQEMQSAEPDFQPASPYATAKLFAHHSVANYRESYDLFACCGILFNHESPLRGLEFVTRKITDGIAKIKLGITDKLTLGNLDACRDWGYAPEYVEAMWLMMQHDEPGDFIIATGETHSIRDFVNCACNIAGIGIRWKGEGIQEKAFSTDYKGQMIIDISLDFYRPNEVEYLKGMSDLKGWKPKVSFHELVAIMLNADMERLSK